MIDDSTPTPLPWSVAGYIDRAGPRLEQAGVFQRAVARNFGAKAALDTAVRDLVARRAGLTLPAFLAGPRTAAYPDVLRTDVSLSAGSADDLALAAVAAATGRPHRGLRSLVGHRAAHFVPLRGRLKLVGEERSERRGVRFVDDGLATAPLIGRAHKAGLHVHVWTVNDKDLMTSLLDLGVDGIMTDQTELLRDVLVSRGQWHPRAGS